MTNKSILALCLISTVAAAVVTRYYFPKIETKTVETTKEVVRNDIKTVTRTVTSPNGQTDTTTVTEDHSIKKDSSNKIEVAYKQLDWLVSGSVQSNFKFEPPIYGVQVQRRILGPIYVGALADTKGQVGLTVGFEF